MAEEIILKCSSCRKELDLLDIHHLPGEEVFDPISGLRYGTGANYCEKCYGELTGQNQNKEELAKLESKSPILVREINKIDDLREGQTNVNLIVEIEDKKEKRVEKEGRHLRLGLILIRDDSGTTYLTLWEDIVDLVKIGDKIAIKNGFVREFKGQKKVTLGKDGELINLSAN